MEKRKDYVNVGEIQVNAKVRKGEHNLKARESGVNMKVGKLRLMWSFCKEEW